MAGHSKWANIKRTKEATDAKRAKLFCRLAYAITIAARLGGDIQMNPRLRVAVEKARAANMPKEKIERAIEKAIGGTEENVEALRYEIHLPEGNGLIAEILTDNKNRTASEIKALLKKYDCALALPGSLSWQFDHRGVIEVQKLHGDAAMLEEVAILAGADDIQFHDTSARIITLPDQLDGVEQVLKDRGWEISDSSLQFIPKAKKVVTPEALERCTQLLEALEDHQDIQTLYHTIAV